MRERPRGLRSLIVLVSVLLAGCHAGRGVPLTLPDFEPRYELSARGPEGFTALELLAAGRVRFAERTIVWEKHPEGSPSTATVRLTWNDADAVAVRMSSPFTYHHLKVRVPATLEVDPLGLRTSGTLTLFSSDVGRGAGVSFSGDAAHISIEQLGADDVDHAPEVERVLVEVGDYGRSPGGSREYRGAWDFAPDPSLPPREALSFGPPPTLDELMRALEERFRVVEVRWQERPTRGPRRRTGAISTLRFTWDAPNARLDADASLTIPVARVPGSITIDDAWTVTGTALVGSPDLDAVGLLIDFRTVNAPQPTRASRFHRGRRHSVHLGFYANLQGAARLDHRLATYDQDLRIWARTDWHRPESDRIVWYARWTLPATMADADVPGR